MWLRSHADLSRYVQIYLRFEINTMNLRETKTSGISLEITL